MIVSSFLALIHVPIGYDPSHLTVVRLGMTSNSLTVTIGGQHSSPEVAALEGFADQLRAIPGAKSASYATGVPFVEPAGTLEIQRIGGVSEAPRVISEIMASPNYLGSMGIRMLQGVRFSPHGIGEQEIILNQTLAKELWPGQNPTNQTVRLITPAFSGIHAHAENAIVVGVIEDLRLSGYAETPEPTIISSIRGMSFFDVYPMFVVNGSVSPETIKEVASKEATSLLPNYHVISVDSGRSQADASLGKEKQRTYFALAGGMIMAFVAYIGLYAALTYYVNTRRRELAVRICLGASPWTIRKIVLSRAAWCASAAVLMSLPLWPLLSHLSSSDYLGRLAWSTADALLMALTCVLLSVLVSLLPAMAAASVSPSEVLKEQ